MKQKQCKCGGMEFTASQVCYHDVVVDGDNIFLDDAGIFEAERPYGPYCCKKCGAEYDDFDGLAETELIIGEDTAPANPPAIPALNQNRITTIPQKTIHISWDSIDPLLASFLSDLLGRDVAARAGREGYYYWKAALIDPISKEDLDALLEAAQASEHDREANDFGEYPIMELAEGLCNKMVARLLPFDPVLTRADDDGVWFIGGEPQQTLECILPKGLSFTAKVGGDTDYPGVFTYLKQPDGREDMICFAEYNPSKPDGMEICTGAYAHNIDEPAYYASYQDDGVPCGEV